MEENLFDTLEYSISMMYALEENGNIPTYKCFSSAYLEEITRKKVKQSEMDAATENARLHHPINYQPFKRGSFLGELMLLKINKYLEREGDNYRITKKGVEMFRQCNAPSQQPFLDEEFVAIAKMLSTPPETEQ